MLPWRQNDITLKQHPAAYFLPDIRKVTRQLLRRRGGGLKTLVEFIYFGLLQFSLTFSCFFINTSVHYMLSPAPSSTTHFAPAHSPSPTVMTFQGLSVLKNTTSGTDGSFEMIGQTTLMVPMTVLCLSLSVLVPAWPFQSFSCPTSRLLLRISSKLFVV